MTPITLLSTLYACSGLAACAFYGPQIVRLLRHAEARRALAASSWCGWLGASVVAVLYAVMVTGEPEMVAVSGLNAVCQAVVVALVLGQRLADRRAAHAKGRALAGPAPLGWR